MSAALTLGGMSLINPGGGDYQTAVVAEGTSRGNPVPIEVAVKSWMQDGAIVVTQGYDNREIRIRVRFTGDDLQKLGLAEAALFAELGKPNTLTWQPSDDSPASVFVVVTSSLEPEFDDLSEVRPTPSRYYTVRLVCEAFVRAVDETVTAALGSGTMTVPPTPTSVVVDDGTSTTGWSGNYYLTLDNGSPASSGATSNSVWGTAVRGDTPAPHSPPNLSHRYAQLELKRAGTVDVSATKQIVVTWMWWSSSTSPGLPYAMDFRLLANEATDNIYLERVGGTTTPAMTTFTEVTFKVPSSLTTITSLRFIANISNTPPESKVTTVQESLMIDSVVRNNADASVSTPRQLQRTVTVAGSARTPASVAIEHETSALGDVLAYFWRDLNANYSPPLRQFRTSGSSVTFDASLVSGAWDQLVGNTTVFTIPANRVPQGNYLLMVRAGGANVTATFFWTAYTFINNVDTGPTFSGSRVSVGLTSAYQNIPLGTVDLPTRDVNPASTTAQVRIAITASVSSGSTARLDEAWIFHTDGQLIATSCGTGTPASGGASNRLFITSAEVGTPRPTVRTGHLADGSDSAAALTTTSWQFPEFGPPSSNILTVTSNALDAAATLRHFRRAHSNIA